MKIAPNTKFNQGKKRIFHTSTSLSTLFFTLHFSLFTLHLYLAQRRKDATKNKISLFTLRLRSVHRSSLFTFHFSLFTLHLYLAQRRKDATKNKKSLFTLRLRSVHRSSLFTLHSSLFTLHFSLIIVSSGHKIPPRAHLP